MSRRVVVVGGGIAGLAAAYELSLQTEPRGLEVLLLEAGPRLGGVIRTEREAGYLIEQGPDSFVTLKPWAWHLCRELGLEQELIPTGPAPRRAYVRLGRDLLPLPSGLFGLMPGSLPALLATPLLSLRGKARAACEWFIPPRLEGGDESVAGFACRRFGREVYERIVDPLIGGVYAGDGEALSLRAALPSLVRWEQEHGSVLRAALRQRRAAGRGEEAPPLFLTLRDGMERLVHRLHERLRDRLTVVTNCPVVSVARRGGAYHLLLAQGRWEYADAVILATPASAAARIVEPLDREASALLLGIPYAPALSVYLAVPEADLKRPLDGHGYLVPRSEGSPVLACTWVSSKFPGRAPEGHALLRVFLGRRQGSLLLEREDDALLRLAAEEVERTLALRAGPVWGRVIRLPRGLPQYTLGHLDRVEQLRRRLAAHPGLEVAGAAYDGIGVPDCVRSGRSAARRVLEALGLESEVIVGGVR